MNTGQAEKDDLKLEDRYKLGGFPREGRMEPIEI